MEKKVCSKCKTEKELCEFQKDSYKKMGYKSQCKKCSYIQQKIYKEQNAELISKKRKKYYQDNIEREKLKQKEYREKNIEKLRIRQKNKYRNNLHYKIKVNVRRRLNKVLHNKKTSSFDIVGCSADELRTYLENKFLEGMNWKNYGKYGWHIDHIIPLDSANTNEEIIKLCHYSNLQPLWATDNLKKSNKIL